MQIFFPIFAVNSRKWLHFKVGTRKKQFQKCSFRDASGAKKNNLKIALFLVQNSAVKQTKCNILNYLTVNLSVYIFELQLKNQPLLTPKSALSGLNSGPFHPLLRLSGRARPDQRASSSAKTRPPEI
jgi:hypothetical protein